MNDKATLAGLALAIIGLLLAIGANAPEEWTTKIDSWRQVAQFFGSALYVDKWRIISIVAIGFFSGYLMAKSRTKLVSTVIEKAEFEKLYNEIITSHSVDEIIIFGYTFETVRDFQKFDHLYKKGLKLRVLNRSWIAEAVDEGLHNGKLSQTNIRPWSKSQSIRQQSETQWSYPASREVRYYDFTHPFLKAVILVSKTKQWAFVNFYEWQSIPPSGGSPFKGADLSMIYLSSYNSKDEPIIKHLVSQFELVWNHRSLTASDVSASHYRSYMAREALFPAKE